MARPQLLVALQPFYCEVGGQFVVGEGGQRVRSGGQLVVVQGGQRVRSDHPVVKGREQLFEPVEAEPEPAPAPAPRRAT